MTCPTSECSLWSSFDWLCTSHTHLWQRRESTPPASAHTPLPRTWRQASTIALGELQSGEGGQKKLLATAIHYWLNYVCLFISRVCYAAGGNDLPIFILNFMSTLLRTRQRNTSWNKLSSLPRHWWTAQWDTHWPKCIMKELKGYISVVMPLHVHTIINFNNIKMLQNIADQNGLHWSLLQLTIRPSSWIHTL